MNFTSKQKNGVPLLDRYRCFVCQKWKHNALFSKKQLGTYTYKIASGQSEINGVTAHLRCMLCNGGQSTELKCQGPCGLVRALDGFSKQARSNGGSQWCQACTAWKEAQEPGVTTAPAISTDIAPDEQDTFATTTSNEDDGGALSDPEAGAYSDDDYDSYSYAGTAASEVSAGVRTNFSEVPYQGFGALSLSGASENQTENIPFGLPSRVPAGNTYTAYDHQGHAPVKQRTSSETASQASNATVAPPRSSKWAKPAKTVEPKTTTPVAVPPRRGYASDSEDEM
ncbi:Stc1 domain containing protein [Hyaloscypha variabilis]